MQQKKSSAQRGQSTLEYALLLVLVALIVIPMVVLFGGRIPDIFRQLFNNEPAAPLVAVTEVPSEGPTEIPTVPPSMVTRIAQDFMTRILDYYNKNGKWPSANSAHRFTDIGLNISDWTQTVAGVHWDPNGSTVKLGNKKGDTLQLYVNDLNGNKLKVYDGWNVVCVASTGSCYYKTVAPGNEVDINSLVAVEE